MLTSPTDLEDLVQLAPEWRGLVHGVVGKGSTGLKEIFNQVGAKALFLKALTLTEKRARLLALIRDGYFQSHLYKMLTSNQNLRRFWSQRRILMDEQRQQAMSLSVDLAHKMEGVLIKQLNAGADDGFKVLLPAYIQRTVHNAVVDYIRQEWSWERQTLQDLSLDPDQDDPRQNVADAMSRVPENQAISNEQVEQLNQLRAQLTSMLNNPSYSKEPLAVIDCLFGLGITKHATAGEEMTMRECCDRLNIKGETPARRIARCQLLLDKGLDMIRQQIRQELPGIVESWQSDLNLNIASRRELASQLGMTEGEIERLVANRQYYSLDELIERKVIKPNRLSELTQKGAVAAFVPVDLNSATVRDMVDILGLKKEEAQKLASERPFRTVLDTKDKRLLDTQVLEQILARGAVVRVRVAYEKSPDLNQCDWPDIVTLGIPEITAKRIFSGRPFLSWAELEDFLSGEVPALVLLRQKFCLGLSYG